MSPRMSRNAASLFALLFLAAAFVAALQLGMRPLTWFALMFGCAIVLVAVGPRWYRLLGAVGLILSLTLIASDYRSRKQYREWQRQFMQQSASQQSDGGPTNRSSQ